MREILFRGKVPSGKWVYGLLCNHKKMIKKYNCYFFISNSVGSPYAYEVVTDTICQSSAMYDKNENIIFENYIIKFNDNIFRIIFLNGCFIAFCEKYKYSEYLHEICINCEIIGNIFDNKECF